MIGKLKSADGAHETLPPSNAELMDKINELVDVVNRLLCRHPDCREIRPHGHNPSGSIRLAV